MEEKIKVIQKSFPTQKRQYLFTSFAAMNSFTQLTDLLKEKLNNNSPLPGRSAQMQMAPASRRKELEKGSDQHAKHSAVLILFFPRNKEPHLIMIKRAFDNSVHSNQIAFPGGKWEKDDLSLKHTSLRETMEEIGVSPSKITVLGQLTELYIPPSNFNVTPFVGITPSEPILIPNEEVEKVLVISIAELLNQDNRVERTISVRETSLQAPCFILDGEIVWGASAMILAELLELIETTGLKTFA